MPVFAILHRQAFCFMNQIQQIISEGTLENLIFKLPDVHLERPVYEEVDKVLSLFGGKWKKGKGHVFESDPSDFFDLYLQTGELPPKNPLAFFATPKAVVDKLMGELDGFLYDDLKFLEPTAGTGNFVQGLIDQGIPQSAITALELDPYRYKVVKSKFPEINGLNQDFLSWPETEQFDVVVMNPPFSTEDKKNVYIDHVYKAWNHLTKGGKMIAILPLGWLTGQIKAIKEFREWVYQHGLYFTLDEGVFKESGTMVNTCCVVIEKYTDYDFKRLYQDRREGHLNYFIWNLLLHASCDYEFQSEKMKLWKRLDLKQNVDAEIWELYEKMISIVRKHEQFMPVFPEWKEHLLNEFKEEWKTDKENV